jgi:AcrR family transcriptional regulator
MGAKGASTRQTILDHAVRLASQLGLEGLSIGALAQQLALSKSGLFAHFRSKESLQIQVLDTAAAYFVDAVVRPAVQQPRGLPRVEALFENWIRWNTKKGLPGGCIFIAASAELDDRPGPVRDHLVQLQAEWRETRRRIVESGIEAGHFRPDLDAAQVGYELFGILMAYHHSSRLLADPAAETRARKAFRDLLERIRLPKEPR